MLIARQTDQGLECLFFLFASAFGLLIYSLLFASTKSLCNTGPA
jgi:hypothetical protein